MSAPSKTAGSDAAKDVGSPPPSGGIPPLFKIKHVCAALFVLSFFISIQSLITQRRSIQSLFSTDPFFFFAGEEEASEPQPVIREFERQEGAVIVTKLHGPHQLFIMEQSLCLLQHAYNHRVNYDIVAFTTTEIQDSLLEPLRQLVAPANLTVVVDNRGLEAEMEALSPVRRKAFVQRCNVTKKPDNVTYFTSGTKNLTWWSECPDRLAYNWQAEFRSWHIWKHSALAPYRYMLWLDTDGFCTRVWQRDPIAFAMQNQLTLLFANFPQGRARGRDVQQRVVASFNQSLCTVTLRNGTLFAHTKPPGNCPAPQIPLVHGFMHVTDLDFFRSDAVQRFVETWIGDCFLCRKFDDQGAVTLAAAMLAANQSWDMRAHDINLQVYHNGALDGKERAKPAGFKSWWPRNGNASFPQAYGKCRIRAGN